VLLHNHEAECAVLNFIGPPDGSTPITMDNQGDSCDIAFALPLWDAGARGAENFFAGPDLQLEAHEQ
jgi:hypothetical protein